MKLENAPFLRSNAGETMVLRDVRAKGHLSGMLFELSVQQRYRNPTTKNLEIVYTFPLAWGAVLLGLEISIGGKTLTGVVIKKKIAESLFEKAIAEGDSPIMVERAADGLYTVNLGNLMGGEEATITYRYAQMVQVEQGRIRLTVPTTIAPRYGEPRKSGMHPHQAPDHSLIVEYPFSIEVGVDAPLASAQISSPSHEIKLENIANGTRVLLAQEAYMDRDFVLTFSGLPTLSAATVAPDGDQYVVEASFCPLATQELSDASPRSLKILIDCSGSMKGDSISVAKRALHAVVSRLRTKDCFDITRFGSGHEHLFKELQPAQDTYLEKAKSLVLSMDADMGGTEITKALRAVYRLKGPSEAADVLLITDGEIHAVEPLIKEARTRGQRIFAVGVGNAPAETLLRRLAEETGGACELVVPGDHIEAAAISLVTRMRSPQSENVNIDWPAEPLWTASVPSALYAGDTVHVFAGFDARPEGEVALRFSTKDRTVEQVLSVTLPKEPIANDTLARVAAAERMKDGMPEKEALELAIRHQLVTSMTNYLVIHERAESEKAKDFPALAAQAQMLAAGWGGFGSVEERFDSVASMADAPAAFLRQSVEAHSDSHESLDMPAFLLRDERPGIPRAAHKRETGESLTPTEFAEALAWDFSQSEAALPRTIRDLRRLGVPQQICDELERLAALGIKEQVVVAAFMEALFHASPLSQDFERHLLRSARSFEAPASSAPELRRGMAHVMSQCGPQHWPKHEAWREPFGG